MSSPPNHTIGKDQICVYLLDSSLPEYVRIQPESQNQ